MKNGKTRLCEAGIKEKQSFMKERKTGKKKEAKTSLVIQLISIPSSSSASESST